VSRRHEPSRDLHDPIDLWLCCCKDVDARTIQDWRDLLPDEERSGEHRFVFARDRRRYVVTRALIRMVLSRYSRIPPTAWRFTANDYGRPEIANDGAAERDLSFNISHTSDLILIGVTRRGPLGVDIEASRRTVAPIEVADRFFSTDEVSALKAVPLSAQHDRFFEYWTLKESYIKARGMGLSIPLDSFAFDLSSTPRIKVSFSGQNTDTPANWHFWLLRPVYGYVAAVCARRTCGVSRRLSVRKIARSHLYEVRGSVVRTSYCL